MTKVQVWLMRFLSVAWLWSFCLSRFVHFESFQSMIGSYGIQTNTIPTVLEFLFPYMMLLIIQGIMTYAFFLNPPQTSRNILLRHGAVLIVVTAIRTYATLADIDAAATWDWVLGYWAVTIPMLLLAHGIVQLIFALIMKRRENHMQTA